MSQCSLSLQTKALLLFRMLMKERLMLFDGAQMEEILLQVLCTTYVELVSHRRF